ncbi:MAG: hypothetical protein ASARMPREDX12_006807 [Alectoria sarmentosa]|nr:MAG: hypothetical protein ASARMPREDX12_006807 [Alectoria sarmentosa]
MEDFIERVGESYLERKAFAVPQQLENLVKKQLTGGGEKVATAKKSTGKKATEEDEEEQEQGEGKRGEEGKRAKKKKKNTGKLAGQTLSGSSEKDKEIARLKKQLAQSKLEKPKAFSGQSASVLKGSGIGRASNGQMSFSSKAAKGNKETKAMAALGAVGAAGGRHEEKKSKSGEKEEARSRGLAKEATIVEISPTRRKTSASQHSEHGGPKSEHGGGSKSENGGHAKSTAPDAAAVSNGKRRPSTASQSEHGSTAKSVGPAPMHEQLPLQAERPREVKAMVEPRRSRREDEGERDLYAVEVEEDVRGRRGKDAGGVVEVESSKGRTMYRVG